MTHKWLFREDSVDKPDRSMAGDDEDDRSLSVSSFDWSISSNTGRGDVISWHERMPPFSVIQKCLEPFKQEAEVTLEELQQFSNSEPDPADEARLDQVSHSNQATLNDNYRRRVPKCCPVSVARTPTISCRFSGRSPQRKEPESTPLLKTLAGRASTMAGVA